jgi:hypothetical protein
MKTAFYLTGMVWLLAAYCGFGQDAIVKQRAKELRDQNNVRQGVAPPVQGTSPGTTAGGPAAPGLSPGLAQFQSGLATIKPDSLVTTPQMEQLSQALLTAAQGTKPSLATITKLVADLTAAYSEKPLPTSSRARLLMELDAILNPAKYPQAKPEGIFRDIQAIFQENGLTRNKAVAIAEDVKMISAQVQGISGQ